MEVDQDLGRVYGTEEEDRQPQGYRAQPSIYPTPDSHWPRTSFFLRPRRQPSLRILRIGKGRGVDEGVRVCFRRLGNRWVKKRRTRERYRIVDCQLDSSLLHDYTYSSSLSPFTGIAYIRSSLNSPPYFPLISIRSMSLLSNIFLSSACYPPSPSSNHFLLSSTNFSLSVSHTTHVPLHVAPSFARQCVRP